MFAPPEADAGFFDRVVAASELERKRGGGGPRTEHAQHGGPRRTKARRGDAVISMIRGMIDETSTPQYAGIAWPAARRREEKHRRGSGWWHFGRSLCMKAHDTKPRRPSIAMAI